MSACTVGRVLLERVWQGCTALIWAASRGHIACVQALVAAKAALNSKAVSDARVCALNCPARPIAQALALTCFVRCCVYVCVCVCACVCTSSSFVTVACIWMIVRSFCVCARIKLILPFVIPG